MSRKNVKGEILRCARKLFNQQGYHPVSMRDIADALHISVGNVTYHYPHKEHLLCAIVEDMPRYSPLPCAARTLEELNAAFPRIQNQIQENAFYFWNNGPSLPLAPEVVALPSVLLQQQLDFLRQSLTHLQDAGLICWDKDFQWEDLASALHMGCLYHVPYQQLCRKQTRPFQLFETLWALLTPFLTPLGQETYEKNIVQVRLAYEKRMK